MHRAVFSLLGMGLLRLSKLLRSYAMHVGYAIIPVGKFCLVLQGVIRAPCDPSLPSWLRSSTRGTVVLHSGG